MFSEIINPFLNVRNKVKDYKGDWVDQIKPVEKVIRKHLSRIQVDGELDYIVFSAWDKKIILEALMIGTNTRGFPVLWGDKDAEQGSIDGNFFSVITREGGGSSPSPDVIDFQNGGESDLLKLTSFDSEKKESCMILKRPLILPQGGELRFRSRSGSEGELSYKVIYREIEE
uniref:Uncharacterized protein n=1 Tax=Siphoviridae sp. ctwrX9 TaxID=2825735 RepID=A0A8S5PVA9_9CAUD|nr:MAG TPA: hypothetical protein [Siphoviridae sp. ctwrX9]